jgi:hypothetical protein
MNIDLTLCDPEMVTHRLSQFCPRVPSQDPYVFLSIHYVLESIWSHYEVMA